MLAPIILSVRTVSVPLVKKDIAVELFFNTMIYESFSVKISSYEDVVT
jgi:hypothetical protein